MKLKSFFFGQTGRSAASVAPEAEHLKSKKAKRLWSAENQILDA